MPRLLVLFLALFVLFLSPACAQSLPQTTTGTPEPTATPGMLPQTTTTAEQPEAATEVDCTITPPGCCRALTPQCLSCVEANKAWEATCKGADAEVDCSVEPVCCEGEDTQCVACQATVLAFEGLCDTTESAAIDCATEPPMCCMAMTPTCNACREQGKRWVEACQKQPGSTP